MSVRSSAAGSTRVAHGCLVVAVCVGGGARCGGTLLQEMRACWPGTACNGIRALQTTGRELEAQGRGP